MPENNTYDVIVMGGGPAGSTCSTLLSQMGRKVLLLEKEKFPRHHIGESLIPNTYWTLKRMGMLPKMQASKFVKKYSVQFANAESKMSRAFYFFETNQHESSVTWQVYRADFDKLMLDHAAENGVEVHEETMIKEVLFDGDQAVGVDAQMPDGSRQKFHCKVVVDATGQTAMLSNKMGIRVRDPNLRKGVLFSYWKGAHRDAGLDEGATLVLKTRDGNGWFWYIPLADDIVSCGIVCDPDYLFKDRGKDYDKILDEEIEKCDAAKVRISKGTRCHKTYVTTDYSFRSKRCSGPGYVLIGDAYGFLDPIYSSGVLLALRSGEYAADSIQAAFEKNDFSQESLGAHEQKLRMGIESMRKLAYAYYTQGFSFAQFLRKYPECRGNLIDLLSGDLFKPGVDSIYGPMSEFYDVPPPIYSQPGEAAQLEGAKA